MGTMAVSFRFKDNATREARYNSFVEQLRKMVIWEETTSFALVETDMTAAQLEADLYSSTDISSYDDKFIVIDVTGCQASARGVFDYTSTLRSLLPRVVIKGPPY